MPVCLGAVSRLLHWAEARIMPWPEIFNPAQEETQVQEVAGPTLQHWTISWALNCKARSLPSLLTSHSSSFCVGGFKLLQPAWGKSPENLAKLQTPTSVKRGEYKSGICSFTTVSHLEQHENTAVGAESSWHTGCDETHSPKGLYHLSYLCLDQEP